MIFLGFLEEARLHLLQLVRVLRGEVAREAEVVAHVVQLPHVLLERMEGLERPGLAVDRPGEPAVVVDRAVPEHLEVLRGVSRGRRRVVERVDHADALDRMLAEAVHLARLGDAGSFEHGRRHVDDVVELRAQTPALRDPLRPMDDEPVAGAAVVRRDLLRPRERGVSCHGPPRGVMVAGERATQLVHVMQNLVDRLRHAVEHAELVEEAVHRPFGAGAVVAGLVEGERVVEHAQLPERLDQTADLVVRLLAEAGEHLHLACEQAPGVGRERVPVGDRRWFGGEGSPRGNHAELALALPGARAEPVPAVVEHPAVLGDPLLRDLVRGVGGPGREVHEERLVGRDRVLRAHPRDCLVRHVGGEVVARVVRRFDLFRAVPDLRRPLVGLAADEAVELLEPGVRGPAVERALDADLPGRGLVVLPERGGVVPIHAEDLGERGDVLRPHAGVARERRRQFHDGTGVVRVMVAAGEQRGPRR